MDNINKLTRVYQDHWSDKPIFNSSLLNDIDKKVTLHKDINNPMSSAAACLNVLGNLNRSTEDIKRFFNYFYLDIKQVIDFPTGVNVNGEIYNDKGPIIFEWIGPRSSPIYEKSGSRGKYKTSVDAYFLAKIDNKITQLLIEWKFTENYSSAIYQHKFTGLEGNERLRRYSSVLAKLRKEKRFPFNFRDEGEFGLYDFNYEPFYQLLRTTLLAKMTTPLQLNQDIVVEDYKIVHLMHSENDNLKYLNKPHIKFSPGLKRYSGRELHDVWKNVILSPVEREHFICGYWNKALSQLSNSDFKDYLINRYE